MQERESIEVAPLLNGGNGVVHGSVARYGGASRAPFDSCNISFGVGDDGDRVRVNRRIIKEYFGLTSLVSAHQVHGTEIYRVDGSEEGDLIVDGYDALITDVAGTGLMIGHADCQTVVLHDPNNNAIAAIHNGWRGSVADIVGKTVAAMVDTFGSRPDRLFAGIGPSLGPCCAEFVNYETELPKYFQNYMVGNNHFDFWRITRDQLCHSGLLPDRISCAQVCTRCCGDYFSYRRACRNGSGVTGRNGSIVGLVDTA